jgi:hypothetical protein
MKVATCGTILASNKYVLNEPRLDKTRLVKASFKDCE